MSGIRIILVADITINVDTESQPATYFRLRLMGHEVILSNQSNLSNLLYVGI